MKRFLVTGATGFLGSHLVDKLLARQDVAARILCRGGNRWTAIERGETGYGDILDVAVVERASRGVDGIFHMAGLVTRDRRRYSELFDTHIRGTKNICDSAVRNGSPRVIVISSSGTVAASRVP